MSCVVIRATSKRHFAHWVLLAGPQPGRRRSERLAARVRRLALMVILLSACDVGMLLGRTGWADWNLVHRPNAADWAGRAMLERNHAIATAQGVAHQARIALNQWLTLTRSLRTAQTVTALVRSIAPTRSTR